MLRIDEKIKRAMEKAGYRIYKTSAVEICHWNKEALRNKRFCYKNKFYGIDTHRCMQISLNVFWCTDRCIYCWRPNHEFQKETLELLDHPEWFPDPGEMLEKLKELRKNLLMGFKGNPKVDKKMFEEALNPNHVTFSLMGEPLLYPKMPEAIKYLKENWKDLKSIFIVSNGEIYEMVEKLIKEKALPTQFYISFTAPNEELYKKITRPVLKDAWERFNKTIEILSDAKTRRVARITIIKGLNDACFEEWAKLIEKYNPHFVEIKAYMYLGYSRFRLKPENQPDHDHIKKVSEKLLKHLKNFEHMDEDSNSRVIVLRNKEEEIDRWIKSLEPF